MKKAYKYNMEKLLIFCLILWVSCKSKQDHSEHVRMDELTEKSVKNEIQSDTNHVHIYSCPMHPEVTGKEGEKCSKCKMQLEHKM